MSRPRREKESKRAESSAPRPIVWAGPAIIMIAAVIAVGPLLLRGPSCSGDFGFHYISWIDAEHSMSMGILYPHWADSPNFGAGDPIRLLPPARLDGGGRSGNVAAVEFCSSRPFYSVAGGDRYGHSRIGPEHCQMGLQLWQVVRQSSSATRCSASTSAMISQSWRGASGVLCFFFLRCEGEILRVVSGNAHWTGRRRR